MLLYDLSHTSHSPARTGVQRVALELRRNLRIQTEVTEITHDPWMQCWRPLEAWEQHALDHPPRSVKRRSARWPLGAQLRGWWRRRTRTDTTRTVLPSEISAILCPEIFTARTGSCLPELFAATDAPRVALFHDAISLRLPDLTPRGNVGRFPGYLQELMQFDGIAAISEDSRQSLLDYWKWADWGHGPEVVALPLACDHLTMNRPEIPIPAGTRPHILSVGSLEGRKNHLTLLTACEQLWDCGIDFELSIFGGLQRETGTRALTKIRELQNAGRPLHYSGWLPDAELRAAYHRCAFTVYPSIMEGFGLPIWESLLHGKACVCADHGAVAESARGGGCLMTDTANAEALADAMQSLLTDSVRLNSLTAEARHRQPPRWEDYTRQLLEWITTLPRHSKAG
ncbi:glycosyltransferase [Synoicihabitans lomoniglobus]|uniref:Glycosyltransferase n=1 Tax=Synoicihabitans lomoniglobus TaxID=2909285 RepID=A0AAF0CST7_9BACT|nr:glycosyltransferase [Opitutaceae bacterium LMO-M01]WED67417.1 glycosyltransferase [Opitutaceae bacterium LMO-M01]